MGRGRRVPASRAAGSALSRKAAASRSRPARWRRSRCAARCCCGCCRATSASCARQRCCTSARPCSRSSSPRRWAATQLPRRHVRRPAAAVRRAVRGPDRAAPPHPRRGGRAAADLAVVGAGARDRQGRRRPVAQLAYFKPLLAFLDERADAPRCASRCRSRACTGRPCTSRAGCRSARGWERQLDRAQRAVLRRRAARRPPATAPGSTSTPSPTSRCPTSRSTGPRSRTGELVERGLAYLRPVWRDAHWQVFAVRRPEPIASGVARAIEIEPDAFTITARRAGDALVRVRHTRWWKITSGRACVEQGPDGMTRVRVLAPRQRARAGEADRR